MAKRIIRTGTTADPTGDSLKNAFTKVNDNFTELYNALGLDADTLNIGAFEFTGSVMTTTDSSAIVIDQATTITSNLSVGGDIVPQTANGGDLGSSTLPWRSLYVSNNTIYIGGTAVGLDANGNLTTGGTVVGSTPAWANITGKPTFATVATSGAYADLTGKPTIPTDFRGSVFADDSTLMVDAVDNKIYATELTVAVGNFVNVNSNNVEVENINGLSSQINFTVGGYNNLVIENNLVTIQNVSLSVAGDITLGGNIRSEGNINIEINLADSTLRRWSFGEDGDTVFPNNVSINYSGNNVQFPRIIADSGKAFSVQGQGNSGSTALSWTVDPDAASQYAAVSVSRAGGDNLAKVVLQAQSNSGDAGTAKTWKFNETGTLTLPAGGTIAEGGGFTGAIKLTPAGGANAYQALLIYPTGFAEGDHLHLTAGGGTTELYLGSDNHYVKLANDGFVIIKADDGVNSAVWGFAPDGTTSIPGDIKSDGNINIDINLTDSTLRRWQFGEDGELTLPEDAVVKTTSGHLTIKGQNNVYIDSATNGQIEIGRSSGVGAVVLGSKSRGTNVVVDDLQVTNGVYEYFSSLADATGVVTHNCANGHIFYHTSPDANWTVNLTNLLDTWNRATSVTIIIAQGATGYYPSAVQIAGVAQTINWQGNATPTPSTNRTDVVTFSIINNSGTYIVLGQLTGF